MDAAPPRSATCEPGRALGAEGGEALGGVVGGEESGDDLALELDGLGERQGGTALHEVLGRAEGERGARRELPGQARRDLQRRGVAAELVDQAQAVGVD